MNGRIALWVVAVCCAGSLVQAAALNEVEARIVKARLVPAPQTIALTDGPDVVLDATLSVTFACDSDERIAAEQTVKTFKDWLGFRPT